jgi:hypothetical protein
MHKEGREIRVLILIPEALPFLWMVVLVYYWQQALDMD